MAAALRWLKAIMEGDLEAAWPLTDPQLRLVLAQAVIWANQTVPEIAEFDRDEAAASLAGLIFDHPLWPAFRQTQLREFTEVCYEFDPETWSSSSRPRPTALDYELVVFIDTGGETVHFEETTFWEPALQFLLHSTAGGWLMAGVGTAAPPEPGWPQPSGEQ